jgi:hypothetical protein
MEDKAESGLPWADAIQRAKERRRSRKLAKVTVQLEKEQLGLSGGLEYFVNVVADDRESWEQISIGAQEIRRLLDKLEKYVLPYRDSPTASQRQQCLKVLAGIKERRKLLAKILALEYEDAARKRPMLSGVGSTYAKLRNADLAFDINSPDDPGAGVPVPIKK